MLTIPADAAYILEKLNQAGHQAYVVGGCVRDALLGREPKDLGHAAPPLRRK